MQYIVEIINRKLEERYHTVVNELKGISELISKLNEQKEDYIVTINPIVFRCQKEVMSELRYNMKPKGLEYGRKKED